MVLGTWEEERTELSTHSDDHTVLSTAVCLTETPRGHTLQTWPSSLLLSLPSGSGGSRWRDYGALAIIMAGIAFGFHQLYKVSCFPGPTVVCPAALWHSALAPDPCLLTEALHSVGAWPQAQ